ncbi:hypothetical protein EV129_12411 [Rhizobium azibense]|uniref:Uncharacterized protein n=1 Tax=Rhizobium azibense TaxID=1136135 RepID=A0A4R3R902_9HYPH|nr:hypothetical protein EV129_12411 [Rhizobium azibense]
MQRRLFPSSQPRPRTYTGHDWEKFASEPKRNGVADAVVAGISRTARHDTWWNQLSHSEHFGNR